MSAKPSASNQAEQALLKRLNDRAAELQAEIGTKEQRQPAHDGKDHTHEVMDRGEEANHHVRVEVRNAEIDRDRTELRNIAMARERIETGTYFECADCGKTINVERLEAQPTATRCIACQEKAEKADERRA